MRRSLYALLPLIFVVAPATAQAGEILFSGSGTGADGVTLNAAALFKVDGTTLTVTLKNVDDTSGNGTDKSANTLTGLFFNLPDNIVLSPVSATIAAGALVQAGTCDPGPCDGTTTNVGGEFGYATGAFPGPHSGADRGIASSGYVPGNSPDFNGPDLDQPLSYDGINFGIIAPITASNKFKPNGGLADDPLIKGEVVFAMTISGGTLTESQISNVSFQYGTGYNESKFQGFCNSGCGGGGSVPEPAAVILLGAGLAAALRRVPRGARARVR